MNLFRHRHRGYSLVEMIVYIALLSMVSLVVVEATISITKVSAQFMVMRDLNHSGRVAIEQMVREIRFASNVDSGASVFNDTDGKLQLDTFDSGGAPHVVEFFVDNGQVKMEKDGLDLGYLTSKNITVTELTFFHISNIETEAVKIVLGLTGERNQVERSITFYNTVLLRGSY